ncbi:MAG: DUF4402 domain-containing protein [Telluria sp.]
MTTPFRSTRLKLILAIAAAAVAPATMAADATATSTSTVVAPIAITKVADLAFGKFAAGATGGTVTISTSGARSLSGGVINMTGSTTTAAQFDVTGETGATYSISLAPTTNLTSPGSDTMAFATISDLTGANTVSGNVASGTLTGGAQSIYVGGVLTVAANQVAGTYSGNVVATVQYN